jgi:hypothetical protein
MKGPLCVWTPPAGPPERSPANIARVKASVPGVSKSVGAADVEPLEDCVPDTSDRDRSIAAYAGEVRAFHAFFGAVLILLALLHVFVLLPYMQLRTAAPTMVAAVAAAEQEVAATAGATKAVRTSTAALVQFRRALEAAPVEMRATIGGLVARGRLAVKTDADPYMATILVQRETAPGAAGSGGEEEAVQVGEAIRRLIGRQTEMLSMAFDAAIEPLRPFRTAPPEVADVVRTAEEGVARNVLALNEVLREAFAADAGFWERLGTDTGPFAGASARAAEWTTGTAEALRLLETRTAAAATALQSRDRAAQARVTILSERNRELRTRIEAFTARFVWLPLGLDGWARLYPILAGGLALTILFRLRRILLLRRALAGIDLDVMAPSWVLGASSAPGRGWAVLLVALPVLATIHGSFAALEDPGLYATLLGEPSPGRWAVSAAVYAVIGGVGVWQLVLVGRGIFGARNRRSAAHPGRAAKG